MFYRCALFENGFASPRLAWPAVVLLCACAAAPAWAQLAWTDGTTQALDAEPGQRAVEVVFPFTNNGDYPITIKRVRGKDRWVSADVTPKRTFRAGESGEVKLKYNIAAVTDRGTGVVVVETDERAVAPQELSLSMVSYRTQKRELDRKAAAEKRAADAKAEAAARKAALDAAVPELLFEPRMLTWEVGEALTPKTMTVTVVSEKAFAFTEAVPASEFMVSDAMKKARAAAKKKDAAERPESKNNPVQMRGHEQFEVQVEVVKPGHEFKLTLTPKSTEKPAFGSWVLWGEELAAANAMARFEQQHLMRRRWSARAVVVPEKKGQGKALLGPLTP